MATLRFDEASAHRLARAYMTPDVIQQRRATLELLDLAAGEAVIDIGSGPGFLCESMADAVGPTGRVVGLDISDDLVTMARQRNTRQQLTYRHGDAVAIDLPDASFEVAVSTQVFEYVADVDRAVHEMSRVLRPGGRAVVVATDWDGVVWHSSDRRRMRGMLDAWEAHCADPRLPRTLVPRLRAAGLDVRHVGSHAIINTRLGADTYSQGLMGLVADYVRKQQPGAPAHAEQWQADLRALDSRGEYFFALPRFLFAATKAT